LRQEGEEEHAMHRQNPWIDQCVRHGKERRASFFSVFLQALLLLQQTPAAGA